MGFANEERDMDNGRAERKFSKIVKIVIVVILFFLAFGIGLVVGAFLRAPACSTPVNTREAELQAAHERFQLDINATQLGNSLKFFSASPHIAGSTKEKDFADELQKRWRSYKFTVEMPKYKIRVPLPKRSNPNKVQRIGSDDKVLFTSGEDNVDWGIVDPFLSYSPNVTVSGRLVYVNYGRQEDFELLKNQRPNIFTGSIAIMRLGKVYPGSMVANAAKYDALGAILYPDPADFAQKGMGSSDVYPQTFWLPKSTVLFGSAYARAGGGDPQTPDYPALDDMYRQPFDTSDIPKIPAHTISYDDAKNLLSEINAGGVLIPNGWAGGLEIDYRVGPFLKNGQSVKIISNNEYIEKEIYNVIGTIQGHEEPDRYVLLGSHRDAWAFGATYAAGGTAIINEIARTLGQQLKNNWRPRRTIKLCSWGGSAPGLLGSAEWVEEHAKVLEERAVAYINLDAPVRGNFVLNASSSPLMNEIIYSWIKKLKDPSDGKNVKTMSDVMNERNSEPKSKSPAVYFLAGASDFVPFFQHVGVSSADFFYSFGYDNKATMTPLLYSRHDTYSYINNKVDPNFQFHVAMAKLSGGILLDVADSRLLPMNTTYYSTALTRSIGTLKQSNELVKRRISLNIMESAVKKFEEACNQFEKRKKALKEKGLGASDFDVRKMNDQTTLLERAFIIPRGLSGQHSVKHAIFAPSLHNLYNSTTFPGIHNAMFEATTNEKWGEVEKQISVATASIISAIDVLGNHTLSTISL